jgi:CRISPR type III-A-associated RAMP protein Csm4
MQPAILIRLRPTGPWRFGPGDGGHDRIDMLYRSDRLYSALTVAARQLGWLDEWLEATARPTKAALAFSSLFPYQGDTLFAFPPYSLWPPPTSLMTTSSPVFLSKTRWSAARFVPLAVIEAILLGQPILADQWMLDAESGCLLRRDRPSSSPFRTIIRSGAAVDRLTGATVQAHSSACLEFEAGAGLWSIVRYSDPGAQATWNARIQAAFRLLADSGFGGRRASGWGHSETPEFRHGVWPALLMPKLARTRNGNQAGNGDGTVSYYWLLSLFSPSPGDAVEWSAGDYRIALRGGRIDSGRASNAIKKSVRMISEGSVLASHAELIGAPIDVTPEGFSHPVYRSGLALALELPPVRATLDHPVEMPGDDEALEASPCDEPSASPAHQAQVSSPPESEISPGAEEQTEDEV